MKKVPYLINEIAIIIFGLTLLIKILQYKLYNKYNKDKFYGGIFHV